MAVVGSAQGPSEERGGVKTEHDDAAAPASSSSSSSLAGLLGRPRALSGFQVWLQSVMQPPRPPMDPAAANDGDGGGDPMPMPGGGEQAAAPAAAAAIEGGPGM